MKVKEIQNVVKNMGFKPGKLNKKQLIRFIQEQEGNNECYATSEVTTCGQDDCLWRTDCLKSQK